MAISEKAKKITDLIYVAYGSGSGILFGIPAYCRAAVESVVEVTLNLQDSVSGEGEDDE